MAEINFNNLYNQLKPMEKRYYDQQFFKNYVPGQENIMLSSQPAYEQMKAVYDAQQQVPEESFLDKINIFGSASAAEMPQVPNLTYRNIDLPFDLRTGVTNTTAASPFLKSMADIDPKSGGSGVINSDLVNQLIMENQMKSSQNFIGSPFLNVPRGTETISPNTDVPGVVEPDGSFRVIPGYINRSNNIYMGDAASAKPNKIDLSNLINMGVANEKDVEQVDSLTGEKEESGIMKLLKFLTPGNLLGQILPKQDPRATGIRNFYSPEGLTSTGSIASGIMKGYNPVSGGFLNMITGGKFGKPTQYGLAGAMQRRIENILGRKAAQTDASRAKVAELRNLQRQEIQDRSDRGESLGSIGRSTFTGPGMSFEKRSGGSSGKKGTSSERNYGGR